MGTFGAPQPSQSVSDPHDEAALAQAAEATEVETIDPNDPRLVSESLEVNTQANAYAQPVPPPDGKYRSKLKIHQLENAKKEKVDYLPKMTKPKGAAAPTPYFYTAIEATIIDPSGKFDGLRVYDRWVGTTTNREGASKVATILTLLKRPDGTPWVAPHQRMTHGEWIKVFVQALSGEPEIGIDTQWEWSCQACGEEAKATGKPYPRGITGMYKFPPSKQVRGAYDPEMKCTANAAHGYSRAQVRVAGFLGIK